MADNPTRPPQSDAPPSPPRPPEQSLQPTAEFQQKLDAFRAQKEAKQDAGQMVDHRAAKAENAAARDKDENAGSPQRADASPARAAEPKAPQQRPSADATEHRRAETPVLNEPSGLRPTPEFQEKLEAFRAQKEAKQDARQMVDHRAAKAQNADGATPRHRAENAERQRSAAPLTEVNNVPRQMRFEQALAHQAAAEQKVPQAAANEQGHQSQTHGETPRSTGNSADQQRLDPAQDLRHQDVATPNATGDNTRSDTTASDAPPRPGDNGFDPGEHYGELGDAFRPGCHDAEGRFDDKERRIAQRLTDDGASVHPRFRDDTVQNKQNPDAMVRVSPEDPGTVTEFKTLQSADSSAVQRNILKAGKQVEPYGGGDAVIDGRDVKLTADAARHGYARAVGQARDKGMPLPEKVTVIIGDGSLIVFPEGRARV